MNQPYDIVKVLYGSETYYKNCPAFCRLHHCHLTKKQLKKKGCLGKQCRKLDKIKTHNYWEERQLKKELKKGGSL
ncbi:MAG: hypothetical protein IKN54_08135 [Lachnospiraceae bacterium]|nr:hypothetical protein [Lachnospiraceae bacterium]